MNAVNYDRVSTAEQVDGFSLDAQHRAATSYCEAHGWALIRRYVDEGVSAAKESASQRPAFRKLLEDVERGGIDVVIVHKLDRFSRNLTVTIQSLARIYKAGATFVSLSEHIDYTTPQGRLMLSVIGAFAEFYSDNLGTEVSKGRAERHQRGLTNGPLPFGYTRGASTRHAPSILPAEGALVKKAYELYASGAQSAHEIANWLNEQGARPRSVRGETFFTKATVIDMLSNPFYAGQVRYRGQSLEGLHEAIVPLALFDIVTATRVRRRRMSSALRAKPARTYLLRGLARCCSCGETLWCSPDKHGPRYRDTSRLKQRQCGASVGSVIVEDIDGQMAALMRRIRLPDDWRERLLFEIERGSAGHGTARRQRIREQLGRLRDVYLDGDLSRAQYDTKRAALRAELESLDAEAAGMADNDVTAAVVERLGRLWDNADETERADLVRSLFQEVYLDLDRKAIEWVKPHPQFNAVFDALRVDGVVFGDPDRYRVNQTQLFAPLAELVKSGAVYTPGELTGVA